VDERDVDERDERQREAHDAPPHEVKPTAGGAGQIDIERLAERVYQLMLAEARQARARGATFFAPERR